jgi:hypothetical protein
MLFKVLEPDLDQRFAELRRAVESEVERVRRELIEELARGIARMREATNEAEWRAAVIESGRAFSGDARAIELIGTLAALTAPGAAGNKAPAIPAGMILDNVSNDNVTADNASAQRFARVKLAEIKLYHGPAVKAGRVAGDLYGSLQPQIDAAREAFRERFLTPGQQTADYLHAELVRELANDDAKLLGPNYPGPLA